MGIDWFRHFDEYEVLPDGEVVVHGNNYEDSIEVAPGVFKPSTHYIWLSMLPTTEQSAKNYLHQLVQELQHSHHLNLIKALMCEVPSHNSKLIGQSQSLLRALERVNQAILYEQAEVMGSRMVLSPYRHVIQENCWLRKLYVLMFDQDFVKAVRDIKLSPELVFWLFPEEN